MNVTLFGKIWNCKDKKISTKDYGNYLLIDEKYKAFFVKTCWDYDGGHDCRIFKNKGYTYTIIWADDSYDLTIENRWNKNRALL